MYHLPRAAWRLTRVRGDSFGEHWIDSRRGSSAGFARARRTAARGRNVNAHTDLSVAAGSLCGPTKQQWSVVGNAQFSPRNERVAPQTTTPPELLPNDIELLPVLMVLRLDEMDRDDHRT